MVFCLRTRHDRTSLSKLHDDVSRSRRVFQREERRDVKNKARGFFLMILEGVRLLLPKRKCLLNDSFVSIDLMSPRYRNSPVANITKTTMLKASSRTTRQSICEAPTILPREESCKGEENATLSTHSCDED